MTDRAPSADASNASAEPSSLDGLLEEAYDVYPQIEEAFDHFLDSSLNPRGPDSLLDLVGSLELPANGEALDVGCGEGRDAIALARRFGLRVHGIDPVRRNIEISTALAAAEGVGAIVTFQLGVAEDLPVADKTTDLIWCKETLMFTDLNRALSEFARVLRPKGVGLVYQVLTGQRMSDVEARTFWESELGYGRAHSVRPADIEAAITLAGLELRRRIDFAGEWGEYAQEQSGTGGRRLVHTARLLRDPQHYVERFGEAAYRIMTTTRSNNESRKAQNSKRLTPER